MIYRVVSIGPLGTERLEYLTNDRHAALIMRDRLTAQRRGAEFFGVIGRDAAMWVEWWLE